MKKIISGIAFCLVLLAVVYWLISNKISDRRSKAQTEKVETEKCLQTETFVADMIVKHNAVTNWERSFDKKDSLGLFEPIYTVEVEDALVRTDQRPIIFFASVADVERETNKYSVHFHNRYDAMLSDIGPLYGRIIADIHFVLDCTQEQFKEIMLHRGGLFEKYAVIAQISEVKKVKLKATASSESDKVILIPSDVFVAEGRCLELRFVGDYEPSKGFLKGKSE
jgi:hypothetical protein